MQLQGLMLMLFMLVIIPIVILFANPNIFFVIVAIMLIFISLKKINKTIFNITEETEESDDELIEDLELAMNIDIKKLGVGIQVVKNLIFILFFIYSSFYIHFFWIKTIAAIIIIYWIYEIINTVKSEEIYFKNSLLSFLSILINASTIILIILVICNKFIKPII